METIGLTEAATLLRMSEDALMRKARAGIVPGAKVGRQWVFVRADLIALIREQAKGRACRSIAAATLRTGGVDFSSIKEADDLPPVAHSPIETAKLPSLSKHAASRRWREPEPTLRGSLLRIRRIKQATPKWADRAAIAALYVEARRLGRRTKIKRHVDHIIPIHGRTVSGLHVEDNLRIITARENVRRPRIYKAE